MNPVVSESPNSFMQAETSVIAGPNGIVAVAWIDVDFQGGSQMGYTFSTNDGATFAAPTILTSPNMRVGSDPVLAVDAAGNIYLTWVGYRFDMQGNPTAMRIYVSKANAGTTTFGQPVQVSAQNDQSFYDKPWITVTNNGTIVVTYQRSSQNGDFGIVAARSTDAGATWSRTFVAHDATGNIFRNLAFPCAPKNGNHLWVTYIGLDANTANADIRLARSDDSGASWFPEVKVSAPNELVAFDDPSCAADLDQVWVAYGLSMDPLDNSVGETQKLYSIQLAQSVDAGLSVAARSEIADLQAASFYMHPQITREDNGALDLVYYAGDFNEDPNGTFRRARAVPPVGFGPSSAVETDITYLQARGDQRWLGDYVGLAWRNGELYTSYVVNVTGTSHVAFAKYFVP